jgi:hypothetical protein
MQELTQAQKDPAGRVLSWCLVLNPPSTMRVFSFIASAVILLFVFSGTSSARVHALLIGVSEYQNKAIKSLDGPRNDVTLLWRRLKSLNVASEDIIILSDGIKPGPDFPRITAPPTLTEIKKQLARLAIIATSKDIVIFYFAGHGVSQPHISLPGRTNIEFNDQVLLPQDAGKYEVSGGKERNGLLDHELGQQLDAIRAKGAFVWAIIDSCHAGYSTRDISNAVVRTVQPSILEIPVLRGDSSIGHSSLKRLSSISERGGMVGFFAVDSPRMAVELDFLNKYEAPLLGMGESRYIGYFTYQLHRALGEGKAQTYRELAALLVAAIASDNRVYDRIPVFDGDLDTPLLSADKTATPKRWPADIMGAKVRVQAGTLHGLALGSDIEIYMPGKGAERIAEARIVESEPLVSVAELERPVNTRVGLVQVKRGGVPHVFRVAAPPKPHNDMVDGLLARAAEIASKAGIRVEIAQSGDANANAWTKLSEGSLLLFSNAAQGNHAIGQHDLGKTFAPDPEPLADEFFRLARAAHLAAIGMQGIATGIFRYPTFEIFTHLLPASEIYIHRLNRDICTQVATAGRALKPGFAHAAFDNDVICVSVVNASTFNVAFAAFYVEPNGKMISLNEDDRGGCWKHVGDTPDFSGLKPAAAVKITTKDDHGQPLTGYGYLVVIASELKERFVSVPSICHLKQAGVTSALELRTRGSASGPLYELLQPTYGMRSKSPLEGQSGVLVRSFIVDVRER